MNDTTRRALRSASVGSHSSRHACATARTAHDSATRNKASPNVERTPVTPSSSQKALKPRPAISIGLSAEPLGGA